jgi:hypothetical protein
MVNDPITESIVTDPAQLLHNLFNRTCGFIHPKELEILTFAPRFQGLLGALGRGRFFGTHVSEDNLPVAKEIVLSNENLADAPI